jgi:hypothetical protein
MERGPSPGGHRCVSSAARALQHGNGHVCGPRYPVFSQIGTIDFDGQTAKAAMHLCGPSQAAPTLLAG